MSEIIEPNEILRDVAERFESGGIAYMLSGSMAMMYYATPRYTADIDIVVELNAAKGKQIASLFEPDYYVPHNRIKDAIARQSMFNLIHHASSFKIDCFIKKNSEFQQNALENRQRVNYFDFEVWITDKEDLIISKLLWVKDTRSGFQMRDIVNLLKSGFEQFYIANWSEKLGVNDLFEECLEKLRNE
ncbi:MAG: hypothetical protein M3525_16440 [Acidobacteriota bacterium]|nr:hypothetical protein [Acidobacteriota bacterium]